MARLHLLRVFCDDDGGGGNPLAVFLDGSQIPERRRQPVAAALGLSETVFVDDARRGRIRILTPRVELGFAGHPTVGSAWLLREQGVAVELLRPPAGELRVRYEDELSFVSARPEWSPPFAWVELETPAAVDALAGPPVGDLTGAWSWLDREAGTLRARVFPVRIGIAEDEATGAAAGLLCAQLGRAIDVRQGRGSRILARPLDDGRVEIGGRTVLDEVREYEPRG